LGFRNRRGGGAFERNKSQGDVGRRNSSQAGASRVNPKNTPKKKSANGIVGVMEKLVEIKENSPNKKFSNFHAKLKLSRRVKSRYYYHKKFLQNFG